ncbi:hypothetical protein OG909_24810 [Streptomyces sp. NBC_01754]|nr:hypothetical protein [Streptomyces sp. NBC_01754]WSC95237.1 hypothetical protein OG909_24810 [Streptomyces sp. NBC_01754]
MTAVCWMFPVAALGAGAILAAFVAHEMPRILGTLALALTLAALAAAIPH